MSPSPPPPSLAEADPKGLVRESYRIEDIGPEECRSIFLDWALSLPAGTEPAAALRVLLDSYGQADHPMTAVLAEGLAPPPPTRRRGGRGARRR